MLKMMKKAIKGMLPYEYRMLHLLNKQMQLQRKNSAMDEGELHDRLIAWFKDETGEGLCLDNPVTFNQKTQWLKLNDSTPLKGRLADKYLVREYISEAIGERHLVPLLGVYEAAEEVDFDALPGRFVLKATHGSGWNLIVKDKAKLNKRIAQKIMRKWLKLDFSLMNGFELHYRYCEPRIVAEEYLDDIASGSVDDYKAYCFNGGDPIICVCRNRFSRNGIETAYYNRNWDKLDIRDAGHESIDCDRPPHLEEMVRLSERLAEGFPFVRVDWYESSRGLLFGELTFTSSSGTEDLEPPEWNVELGNRIDLSRISQHAENCSDGER